MLFTFKQSKLRHKITFINKIYYITGNERLHRAGCCNNVGCWLWQVHENCFINYEHITISIKIEQ